MTYLERKKYRALRGRVEALRDELEEGAPDEPLTREEAREIVAVLDAIMDRMSPDRWDHMMEVVAEEAARRAGQFSPSRSS